MHILFLVIFPVFTIMLFGAIAARFHLLAKNTGTGINQYVTYFALPALFFTALASTPILTIINWPFLYAYISGLIVSILLNYCVIKLTLKQTPAITLLQTLGASFPNTAYMGIPMLIIILGPKAAIPGTVVSALYLIVMVIFVVLIDVELQNDKGFISTSKRVGQVIIKSPLIVSILAGLLWSMTGYPLPNPIVSLGRELGVTAGTCALFAIGKIMYTLPPTIHFKEEMIISMMKLFVQPLIILVALLIFHVDDFWAASGFLLAALPTATIIYIVSQNFNIYQRNASGMVLVTSLTSIVSLFFVLFFLYHFWPNLSYLVHD